MREPIIRATGIVKDYALGRTTLRVLRGVDIDIGAGQFVAIVGSSGSGKSTLLHILGALDIPQRGQVWYRGAPMFEPEHLRRFPAAASAEPNQSRANQSRAREEAAPPNADARSSQNRARQEAALADNQDRARQEAARSATARAPVALTYSPEAPLRAATDSLDGYRNDLRNRAIGFVFQFYHLLPEFDVVENVMMPALVGRSLPRWSAEHAHLRGRAIRLLDSMDLGHRLGHRPNELSGGERQRAAIARALMNDPEVLLADEPTGNLDTKTGNEILERLRGLHAAGQTIVMVTHDAEIARRADRTIRLVDGRAV